MMDLTGAMASILWSRKLRDSRRLIPFGGDYGHGYFYDEFFTGDGSDVDGILSLSIGGRVLDLGGGAGRVAFALAMAGNEVTLVDNSDVMLTAARARRELLPGPAKDRLSLLRQDVRALDAGSGFHRIFSVNNTLEHLREDEEVIETTRRVREALGPGGLFLVDVHHPPFWERHRRWLRGSWRYSHGARPNNVRHHLWERTFPGARSGEVRWEHAATRDHGRSFIHLATIIRFRSPARWRDLFRAAGFAVVGLHGGWRRETLDTGRPKMIFTLEPATVK